MNLTAGLDQSKKRNDIPAAFEELNLIVDQLDEEARLLVDALRPVLTLEPERVGSSEEKKESNEIGSALSECVREKSQTLMRLLRLVRATRRQLQL